MKIVIVDQSESFSSDDAQVAIRACALQLTQHVVPAWNASPVILELVDDDSALPPATTNIIRLLDDGDSADKALGPGWHKAGPNGEAIGKVFARPILDNGGGKLVGGRLTVSTVLSHEIIEAFVDPALASWMPDASGVRYALEACDPVEFETYEITVDDSPVTVSNFLLPAWWSTHPVEGPVDYLGRLTEPFSIRPDGYCVYQQDGAVQTRFGAAYPKWSAELKGHPAARTAARAMGPSAPP